MDAANGKTVHMGHMNGSVNGKYRDEGATSREEQSGEDKSYCKGSPTSSTATRTAGNDDGCAPTATVPTNVAVPPDGGWGWIVVIASFLCNLVVDGIIYSFGMFSTAIGQSVGASKAKVALIGSLLSGSYLIAGKIRNCLDKFFISTIHQSLQLDNMFFGFCQLKFQKNDFFFLFERNFQGGIC